MADETPSNKYHILLFDEVQDFVRSVFAAHGYGREDAAAIADVILCADLYGIESHGIQRLMAPASGSTAKRNSRAKSAAAAKASPPTTRPSPNCAASPPTSAFVIPY